RSSQECMFNSSTITSSASVVTDQNSNSARLPMSNVRDNDGCLTPLSMVVTSLGQPLLNPRAYETYGPLENHLSPASPPFTDPASDAIAGMRTHPYRVASCAGCTP